MFVDRLNGVPKMYVHDAGRRRVVYIHQTAPQILYEQTSTIYANNIYRAFLNFAFHWIQTANNRNI